MAYSNNIPAYVAVYNALYSDIISDIYEQNTFLPSEADLAKKYSVSRNTLRQALAVLNEDGLIVKSQGKGTMIAERQSKKISKTVFNPMKDSCRFPVTSVEYLYNYAAPTDIAKKKLNLKQSDLALASNNIYHADDRKVGFSFVQIPVKVIEQLDIDVSHEPQIEQLIESDIYEAAAAASMNIKLVFANEMEEEVLEVDPLAPLLLLEEILLDDREEPIARCKFYFIPDAYDLHFQV